MHAKNIFGSWRIPYNAVIIYRIIWSVSVLDAIYVQEVQVHDTENLFALVCVWFCGFFYCIWNILCFNWFNLSHTNLSLFAPLKEIKGKTDDSFTNIINYNTSYYRLWTVADKKNISFIGEKSIN